MKLRHIAVLGGLLAGGIIGLIPVPVLARARRGEPRLWLQAGDR